MTEMHPIIANGELYVEPVKKKSGFGDRAYPHEYEEARKSVINDISNVLEAFRNEDEMFLDEKVVCLRLEPGFEAKTYVPYQIEAAVDDITIIGGRRYFVSTTGDEDMQMPAKLYFIKTTTQGLEKLRDKLDDRDKDGKDWRKQICSLHSIDLLRSDEKVMGFPQDWQNGAVEIVLHSAFSDPRQMADIFLQNSGLAKDHTKGKIYQSGPVFISANCDTETLYKINKFNPLRTVHPLGRVMEPLRGTCVGKAPVPPESKEKSGILVGMFDGGIRSDPLINNFAVSYDGVNSTPLNNYLSHGTGVCGAILYGNLAGKTDKDQLPVPVVSVESYRVLPLKNKQDKYLYEAIDAIEDIVPQRKDIKVYNISFGPEGAILDDNIDRFTYALDRLTYDVKDGETNPLFCVAVGNEGDLEYPLNRIQSPSDMANGLGIGAYTFNQANEKIRAYYSCVGSGREGAKVKPDLLEFGGTSERPFIVPGSAPGTIDAVIGTSFASPLTVHKIGALLARGTEIVPHMARTLLIHNAEYDGSATREEQGNGFCPEDADKFLDCEDNDVTLLYSGELKTRQTVRLPIFAPDIEKMPGMAEVKWTITTIVDPCASDTDSYTNNCIEDIFYPHDKTFMFAKKGAKSKKLNLSRQEDIALATELSCSGYIQSEFPASHPVKKSWKETDLRLRELKWDTVIKKSQRMHCSSLSEPMLTLHAIGRNDFDDPVRYFVVVSLKAPKYIGSLYDAILNRYRNLQPITIRNRNRIMVKAV